MRVLLTGGRGFIGAHVQRALEERGLQCRVSTRSRVGDPGGTPETVQVADLGADTAWRRALEGVDTVIHLAGRAHVSEKDSHAARAEFHRVNVDGTRALATASVEAGVRRLVFASTIKVNGERTRGTPFRPGDKPAPEDAYGQSKLEAELALRSLAETAPLEVVVVRPTLVYGRGVRGNLLRLMNLVDRGFPVPCVRPENRRGMVSAVNLADLLVRCATVPRAAGRVYLAADADASTASLVRAVATALGRPARVVPMPRALLAPLLHIPPAASILQRLVGSLQVDSGGARAELGWEPIESFEQGIRRMVEGYRAALSGRRTGSAPAVLFRRNG